MEMKKRSALIVFLATMMLVGGVAAVIWYHFHFHQKLVLATAAKIKVYYDEACTLEFKKDTTLNWGEITSTGTHTKELWIKNVGSVPVILRFDFDRGPHPWLDMYWDYDGTSLALGEVRKVVISLVIPEDVGAGDYWWDGWFEAGEAPP